MQDIKERVAFSKRWAELKTFDKDMDKYIRGLENKISELTEREAKLVAALNNLEQYTKEEINQARSDQSDYMHGHNDVIDSIKATFQSLGLQE